MGREIDAREYIPQASQVVMPAEPVAFPFEIGQSGMNDAHPGPCPFTIEGHFERTGVRGEVG